MDKKKDLDEEVVNENIQNQVSDNENDVNTDITTNIVDDTLVENTDIVNDISEENTDTGIIESNSDNTEDSDITENNCDLNLDTNNEISSTNINEDKTCYTVVKEKKSKKWLVMLIIFIVIVTLALIFSTIFSILNMHNNKIIAGTHILGIDVSNLSKEEAIEKLNSSISEKLSNAICLKHNDYETTVFAEQLEINFDINSAVDTAYSKGRDGNIFENNFNIIYSYFSNINISPSFSYSDDAIEALITEIEPNLPDRLVEPSYYIDNNNLIITKGVDGVIISHDELKSDIIYYFNNLSCKDSCINIPVEHKIASTVDINKIHDEIYKAPQDAYFTTNPYIVHPHVDGIDFSITIEEALQMLAETSDTYTIPLQVLSPNVTTNQIGPEAFPDLLGEFTTTYSTSNRNRSTNISLAASKINGIVIMPGEVFSYNQTVGKRTAAAGFKSAGAYSNGQVINTIGGGICQVSSTLYNAVLIADLEIVERTNHYFNPGYVDAGRDATVSWGGPDFRFKNNRDYPIKIVCSGSGGTVNFKIWGLYVENEYEVVITTKYIKSIPYKTIEQKDSSLAKGNTKVLESGSNGCKTQTYKTLKLNGNVVSTTLISTDIYNPHNRVVAVGTK